MGQPKLLLPFGGQTVIERVISVIRNAGIDRILLVAAPGLPELESTARAAGAEVVALVKSTAQIAKRSKSVWTGSNRIGGLLPTTIGSSFRRIIRLIEPNVIRALITARAAHPNCSIFVPVHYGRRGHPTLIRWRHVAALRDYPPDKGVNQFLREWLSETLEVTVSARTVLDDLDTAEDCRRLRPSL